MSSLSWLSINCYDIFDQTAQGFCWEKHSPPDSTSSSSHSLILKVKWQVGKRSLLLLFLVRYKSSPSKREAVGQTLEADGGCCEHFIWRWMRSLWRSCVFYGLLEMWQVSSDCIIVNLMCFLDTCCYYHHCHILLTKYKLFKFDSFLQFLDASLIFKIGYYMGWTDSLLSTRFKLLESLLM